MPPETDGQAGHRNDHPVSADALNRAILESALDCIITMDATGIVREFNPAAERTFGFTREEAVGQELASLIIPPALRERHRAGLARYLSTGDGPVLGKRIEITGLRKDGSEILIELAINAFGNDEERMFAAYLRDITQRTLGEEATRRLAAIIESSDDAILSKNLNSIITSWNTGAERLFGYTAAEAIGRPVTILFPADSADEEPAILERIRTGQRIEHYETVRLRKDGSPIDVSLTVSPIKDEDGRVIGASKIARDITGRVRADRRRSAQYSAAALLASSLSLTEAAPKILETVARSGDWAYGGIWLSEHRDEQLEYRGSWHEPNAALAEFVRYSNNIVFTPEEGLPGRVWSTGKPVWIGNLVGERSFPRAAVAAAAGLRGAFAFPLACEGVVNGVVELFSPRPAEPDADLLEMAEALGSQIGLFVHRRRIEKELQRQKESAEAANAAKDRFLATLSHELRTPLTPVLMWASETARSADVSAELREDLEMVARNVELEARLIDDLLDLTRISHGKLQLDRRSVDAHQVLGHAIEIVRSELDAAGVKLTLDLQAARHDLNADPARLQQVFWNVLRNARKFTPRGGEVTVRSRDENDRSLMLEFSDTGAGIAPADLGRIFDAFEQLEQRPEGLGLGLAISKAVVEQHGGRITAKSEGLGSGSTFRIVLPLDASS